MSWYNMPEFLDEFASSIIGKQGTVKEKVLKGTPNPLQDHFREKFPSFWVGIDDPAKVGVNPSELSVMAVDSSVYSNLLSTGGVFYVVRSLAVIVPASSLSKNSIAYSRFLRMLWYVAQGKVIVSLSPRPLRVS